MKKMIEKYMKEVDKDLNSGKVTKKMLEIHKDKIEFFQHERFIHLIVTFLVIILTMFIFVYAIESSKLEIFLLLTLLMALLVPYVFHYYFLENSVQKMYVQYDKMQEKLNDKRD